MSLFLLVSCASVPLMSLPKLARLDPETIDISQVELAIRVNDDYRILKDSAKIGMLFSNDLSGDSFKETLILPEHVAPLTKYLIKQKKPGFVLYRYKLDEHSSDAAEKYRANILKFKARNKGDNSMEISASAGFCAAGAANIDADVLLKFYIKTKPKQEFYTLFKQRKMSFRDKGGNRVSPEKCTAENSSWGGG